MDFHVTWQVCHMESVSHGKFLSPFLRHRNFQSYMETIECSRQHLTQSKGFHFSKIRCQLRCKSKIEKTPLETLYVKLFHQDNNIAKNFIEISIGDDLKC